MSFLKALLGTMAAKPAIVSCIDFHAMSENYSFIYYSAQRALNF